MAVRILLLATKDTHAFRREHGQEAVLTGAQLLATIAADPVARYPVRGGDGVEVTVEDLDVGPAWDITPSTMLLLARRTRDAVRDDGYDAVVVTHGIDTLEDTAFLIDLVAAAAPGHGRIVLTGATRPLDHPATDGPRNLAAALTAAADPALDSAGAVICLHDELHAARWANLVDAGRPAAFSSAPHGLLGRLVAGRAQLLGPAPARLPAPAGEPETDVALVKTYPGIDPALLLAAADAGARGLVLEGTGLFNVPVDLLTTIGDLVASDVPVVVATRCRTGVTEPSTLPAEAGLALRVGAISAGDLTAGKARIALMVALAADGGVAAAHAWFNR
ncbi:asparaginase [Solwaraspora sp. WMMB335]|uniref:asparaginase n=1 Tax=Solwaraspora sp. WMMB335 TaxID=3404118 RepID=UPI003B935A74